MRDVDEEMRRRARWQLEQSRLVVNYYRIGRKLAYPLPLSSLVVPEVTVPSIPVYPWATWLLWTLEERVGSLGWAAEWFEDGNARQAVEADLAALATWPTYHQQAAQPDLSSAHAGRILWTASARWKWLDKELRRKVREACVRHVEAVLPASNKIHGSFRTKKDILSRDAPHTSLHNIPLIGTVGAALTATAAGHAARDLLNARVQAVFGAILDLRAKGHSEGVAYDGYVLDFIADWLDTLSENERSAILDHPDLVDYLEQSYMLGAPGAVEQVAELSDVEPIEMPFHLSAQAKFALFQKQPERSWLLKRCPLAVLPSHGLAAMRDADLSSVKVPSSGALDAHYATVLRSGWEADDLAVAVSCSNSPMSHIQADSGTLVIGTQGNWLVTDPGYQQYVRGEERDFTIGPTAHNAPLINGRSPSRKQPRRTVLECVSPSVQRMAIDFAACYPKEVGLKSFVRHVWLSGKNLVVVADQFDAAESVPATYHWHGNAAAAWWFEADWALIALQDARLWFTCSQGRFSGADLQRLPGSRGQLSLVSTIENAGPVVWWVFALTPDRPNWDVESEGRQVRVLGEEFGI